MQPATRLLRRLAMTTLLLLLCVGYASLYWGRQSAQPQSQPQPAAPAAIALPILHRVTDFALIDSAGAPFGLADLAGKTWIGCFFFTTCATICPPMSLRMAELQQKFHQRPEVHFVSVSVNPGYDSPAVLAAYAGAYGADTNQWHFLTGSLAAIEDLSLNGLKIGSKEDPINHSAHFVLVDGGGHVRGYYDSADSAALARLQVDVSRVAGK